MWKMNVFEKYLTIKTYIIFYTFVWTLAPCIGTSFINCIIIFCNFFVLNKTK